MTIDELLTIWKAQDEQPRYAIDYGALKSVLQERSRKLRDLLFSNEIKNYWTGLWIMGFLVLWFWGGPGKGVSGRAYFIALAAAVAAVVYFMAYSFFFVAQRRLRVPASLFTVSLREHLQFEIEYVTNQIAARTEWKRVLLHLAPPWLACMIGMWLADMQGDGTLQWRELLGLAVVTGGWIHMHITVRRWVSRELAPRKKELESLRQRLVAPD